MIVSCAKCETRYRLEEARLSAGPIRVRCSRCKHAFSVTAPGVSAEDALHEVARRAAADPSASPDVTQDLRSVARAPHDPTQESFDSDATVAITPPARGQDAEDDDWQFNDDPAELGSSQSGLPRETRFRGRTVREAPAAGRSAEDLRRPKGEDATSLDALGSPESWDLIGADGAAAPLHEPPAGSAPSAAAEPVEEADTREPETQERAETLPARALSLLPLVGRALHAIGWIATLALIAAAGWSSLAPDRSARSAPVQVAGLIAEDVRGRFVENALGGMLYVVSGSLRNDARTSRAPGALIQVRLLDAGGRALDAAPAAAGAALPEQTLRETAPETLRAELEGRARRLAATWLSAGGSLDFDAVFVELPPEAGRFRLEAVPRGHVEPTSGEEEAGGDATAPSSPR